MYHMLYIVMSIRDVSIYPLCLTIWIVLSTWITFFIRYVICLILSCLSMMWSFILHALCFIMYCSFGLRPPSDVSYALYCPPLCFILSYLFWLFSFIRNIICIIFSCPPAICAFIICVLSYFICLVHSDFIRCVISFILSCSTGMWSFILCVLFFILSCQFGMRPPIRCAICFRLSCLSK